MTIANTLPFIELGWHTIPLSGELKRLPNGKKTIPIFGKDWLQRALTVKNATPTPLGGAITGKESGIIAIDCDNTITYNMFKALDPTYTFHFISKGKQDSEGNIQACGTIVYQYVDELHDSFKITSNSLALDFLSNGRMTYLPTQDNTTKEPLHDIPELKPPPPEITALLRSINAPPALKQHTSSVSLHKFNLAPQVEMFTHTGKVTKALFRLLTPKSFRSQEEYKTKGYLHPNDIAEGDGSTYLSKVSAILGADVSVDVTLYCEAMVEINNCFTYPMPQSRLHSTVIEPMCEGRATVSSGEPIWQEDPDWNKSVMTFLTKYNTVVHVFYDYNRRQYYVIDLAEERIQHFGVVQHLVNHIDSICIESMPTKELKAAMPTVTASASPEKLFGFYEEDSREHFNTFISSTPYKIFKTPSDYDAYKPPEITLKFLETLVPDPHMRLYLLGFLRRKLDTFDYSPVVLFFLGVPGSGKDTLVSLIETIIGESSIERPSAKMFLEKNNAWMLDKLFIQLDEYGDQLTTYTEKREALGLLKQYTGKPRISIRVMREDVYSYDHKVTFIMTANQNPLMLEADDRRIALFDCPNTLTDADWIYAAGGIESVIRRLHEEACDFCYYLATEVTNLDSSAYTSPPKTANKEELVARSMPIAKRIAYLIQTKNWKAFKTMCELYGPDSILDKAKSNTIAELDLVDMYEELKGTGDPRSQQTVRNAMKEADISVTRTTLSGNRHGFKYIIPDLYKVNHVQTEI